MNHILIESLIITLRETLEAALVVGIVLGYLHKTNQTKYSKIVYFSILTGILTSSAGALLFNLIAGGYTGRVEQIFGGVTMLIGAILLTTMILWMKNQKNIAANLEQKIAVELKQAHGVGIFILVFISILREGIETVIFLSAASFVSQENNLLGALIGILIALLLGFLLFKGSIRINLKKFFNITTILLILFAAGLVAHAIHELEEAQIIPIVIEHVWDINPILPEESYFGSLLSGLFGYNGNPSLIEILGYGTYLTIILFVMLKDIPKLSEKKKV